MVVVPPTKQSSCHDLGSRINHPTGLIYLNVMFFRLFWDWADYRPENWATTPYKQGYNFLRLSLDRLRGDRNVYQKI